jgi:hypothetical protein
MAPSTTIGAIILLWRRAATKVIVRRRHRRRPQSPTSDAGRHRCHKDAVLSLASYGGTSLEPARRPQGHRGRRRSQPQAGRAVVRFAGVRAGDDEKAFGASAGLRQEPRRCHGRAGGSSRCPARWRPIADMPAPPPRIARSLQACSMPPDCTVPIGTVACRSTSKIDVRGPCGASVFIFARCCPRVLPRC